MYIIYVISARGMILRIKMRWTYDALFLIGCYINSLNLDRYSIRFHFNQFTLRLLNKVKNELIAFHLKDANQINVVVIRIIGGQFLLVNTNKRLNPQIS
jgi:hypothetical protein